MEGSTKVFQGGWKRNKKPPLQHTTAYRAHTHPPLCTVLRRANRRRGLVRSEQLPKCGVFMHEGWLKSWQLERRISFTPLPFSQKENKGKNCMCFFFFLMSVFWKIIIILLLAKKNTLKKYIYIYIYILYVSRNRNTDPEMLPKRNKLLRLLVYWKKKKIITEMKGHKWNFGGGEGRRGGIDEEFNPPSPRLASFYGR